MADATLAEDAAKPTSPQQEPQIDPDVKDASGHPDIQTSTSKSGAEDSTAQKAQESEPGVESPAAKEPANVSADDLYRRSSQYQVWSFSGPELESQKRQTNTNGAKIARTRFQEALEAMAGEAPEKAGLLAQIKQQGDAELITYEEEQKFVRFFGQQAVQICAHFNMPTQVKATAVQFLRRFYLVHSVMEYRPKNVLYAVVFLSAKSENFFVSIEAFAARLPKTNPEDILDLEFVVLQALKFTLLVHHPFRPLYGFFLDMQQVLLWPEPVMYDVNIDTIGKLYDAGKRWLNDHALLSDVPFLFTPPQIAMAALYDTNRKVTERYLKIKYGFDEKAGPNADATARTVYESLIKAIRKCIVVAKEEVETSREESTKIDEKSFFSINPHKLLKKRLKALAAESSTPVER